MSSYHNEFDPYAAQWTRNLIAKGLIPAGEVDERSIVDVQPDDLKGFTQCHFFAGIGGWPFALRLALWPDDRPVWTGSCPCQPFSAAGKRKGTADERHLWPEFARLINECNPPVVFGEQVASKDGRQWLAGVRADLEALGYAVGAADLCAAGTGAPHIRQRLYWLADSHFDIGGQRRSDDGRRSGGSDAVARAGSCRSGLFGGLAHADGGLAGDGGVQRGGEHGQQPQDGGAVVRMVHADSPSKERQQSIGVQVESEQKAGRPSYANAWSNFEIIRCADGKTRRFEPGVLPLAHGIPNRVGRLRAYGNAIVPQVAAEFIQAYLEARP